MADLTIGRQGESVRKLQEQLVKFDLLSLEEVDGIFGVVTRRAVKRFQLAAGLVADGVVGDLTTEKLNSLTSLPIAPQTELVSMAQLTHIFDKEIEDYLFTDLNACLQTFHIITPERIRHFIAQVAHESAGLQFLQELATGEDYEGREDLGNTEEGDGRRFKGGGAIQLTGRSNYQRFADFMKDDRIMEGVEYVASTYPLTSAGFWWYDNGMNEFVDNGAGVREVSRRVNGGWNGLSDRTRYYNLALDAIAG